MARPRTDGDPRIDLREAFRVGRALQVDRVRLRAMEDAVAVAADGDVLDGLSLGITDPWHVTTDAGARVALIAASPDLVQSNLDGIDIGIRLVEIASERLGVPMPSTRALALASLGRPATSPIDEDAERVRQQLHKRRQRRRR